MDIPNIPGTKKGLTPLFLSRKTALENKFFEHSG
jgi:hypothetical protein